MTNSKAEKLTLTESNQTPNAQAEARQIRDAIRRCNKAWKRTYDAFLVEEGIDPDTEDYGWRLHASKSAAISYCRAMPSLFGPCGTRAFLACLAHGVTIGAISREKSGHLVYAAQVAQSALNLAPKPSRKAPKTPTPPTPPPQNPAFSAPAIS